ncbi:alpha/beta hydrolase family protein [Nonomuraea polychroma]|uniref:Alpha/beta hydrolase family protein n=1 Tax=Nonomuraea polychroma TaxID=46176 RepID=A0A438LYN3_9ACTN|nr:alpha/beta hydrolase [Nonomuraea polychroma]RVX38645.1 alpha/beta hydrolase family protein [Nonomuraea polychroma]
MTTFVLIPGMCHGGWCFEPLTEQLRRHGHRVHPLTLTGLSERSHLLHGGLNLETHIQDVTGVLAAENIENAVLAGHSYGGMVISGVAGRMPDRVDSLVYLDAVVPQPGDSMWSLVSDRERQWYLDVVETGEAVRPLPFFDPRATPHPLASLLQPLAITADTTRVRRNVYVYAAGWAEQSPFTGTYQRLREDPSWTTYALGSGHNLMRDAPQDLLKILLEVSESG